MTVPATPLRLPFVRELPLHWTPLELFEALSPLPGRVWFDSATGEKRISNPPVDNEVRELSRYSFLCADPIERIDVTNVDATDRDLDPWKKLRDWTKQLPTNRAANLPPFQGGVAGVIGYEASKWLEPEELAGADSDQDGDFSLPVFSMGIYDWTLAFDHLQKRGWLISQGLASGSPGLSERIGRAAKRADEVWARLEDVMSQSVRSTGPPELPGFHEEVDVVSNFQGMDYQNAVATVVDRIKQGAAFQVNLSQRLMIESDGAADQVYRRLRSVNPAPFAGFYDGGDFHVLSSSPERFLKLRGRHVETRPIKGTVPRSTNESTSQQLAERLMASVKDRAENVMIVDLMRNDLSRVCEDESVFVSQLCKVERYEYVQHLVSVVEGRLRDDADVVDLLCACFPGGSITGAPKIEAMRMIAELEPNPRGAYCGAMGYISCGGDSDFNILIRTMTATGGTILFPVGGGVTARSQPMDEESETWDKAAGMLKAIGRRE